jgi:hypothetical protein
MARQSLQQAAKSVDGAIQEHWMLALDDHE